ncbi:hypothetical protein SMALA_4892 [Streptomyces malaysiensis subsp. malaysiensis]|nr:hypothetical protein SMALA_4892 [Streptomyces malaysiensis]
MKSFVYRHPSDEIAEERSGTHHVLPYSL